jgi:von Willebrand factor type C domain
MRWMVLVVAVVACGKDTCEYDGVTYEVGDSFEDSEGCNICACEEGGNVACTTLACPTES